MHAVRTGRDLLGTDLAMIDIRTLFARLTPGARRGMEGAAGRCLSATHHEVGIEHLLVTLLAEKNELSLAFDHFGLSKPAAMAQLEAALAAKKTGNHRTPSISPELVQWVEDAWRWGSLKLGADKISSGAIYLALLEEPSARVLRAPLAEFFKIRGTELAAALPILAVEAAEAPVQEAHAAQAEALPPVAASTPVATPALKVFLSYRRSDTEKMVQTLYYCLMSEVSGIKIFRDNNSLEPGEEFAEVIQQNIARCDVLILLMGKKWLNAKDKDGHQRLSDAGDWVRMEIAEALRQKKKIFPCLIDGARMPNAEELPEDLRGVAGRHATSIATASFQRDVVPLVSALQRLGK